MEAGSIEKKGARSLAVDIYVDYGENGWIIGSDRRREEEAF